jgi:hypothetical protein
MKARILLLTVLFGLAACSSAGPPEASTSPPSSPSSSSSSSSSSAPPAVSSAPSPSITAPGTPLGVTIYGVAHPGEEPGCVVLSATDNRVYALLGGDRQIISAGGQLAVTGRVVVGLLNQHQCREGIPFEVSAVRAD